ncbi:ABC transporter ATP-binding protein [Salmonella enterica subsp. salamae]|nr:ABC transporter ATP-binding protein [Salmonella enterica subsp. salamae]
MIHVENVSKTFVLHQQNGVQLPVLRNASLTVNAGECVVLHGHSGSGKSTLLRSLYANYLPDEGHIRIRHGDEWVDLVQAPARKVLEVRRSTIGWVSQFLRVIPRISALDVVMQPLLALGVSRDVCAAKAARLLTPSECPGTAMASCPLHLFRRRTAAREHRARIYRRLPDFVAG